MGCRHPTPNLQFYVPSVPNVLTSIHTVLHRGWFQAFFKNQGGKKAAALVMTCNVCVDVPQCHAWHYTTMSTTRRKVAEEKVCPIS